MASITDNTDHQDEIAKLADHLEFHSITQRHVKTATHTWAIKDFFDMLDPPEEYQRPEEEDYLKSDKFSIPIKVAKGERITLDFNVGIRWNSGGDNKSYIGFYIFSLTPNTSFTIKFKVQLKDAGPTGNSNLTKELVGCRVFENESPNWGWPKAFDKSDLRRNASVLLQDNMLVFLTSLEIECQHSQKTVIQAKPRLLKGYLGKRLWDNRNKTGDVTLICQDVHIPAHKCVLMASSDVLEAMFNYGDMAESQTGTIHFKDISPVCLEDFLHYIYCNSFSESATTLDVFEELLMAAEKYNVVDLKTNCEHKLSNMTNDSNVGHIGVIANMYNASNLHDYVVDYVANNYQDLVKESGEQWKILPSDIIKDAFAQMAKRP